MMKYAYVIRYSNPSHRDADENGIVESEWYTKKDGDRAFKRLKERYPVVEYYRFKVKDGGCDPAYYRAD